MNASILVAKMFALDVPWAIGRRVTPVDATPEQLQNVKDYPFFAAKGDVGQSFTVVGDNLDECIEFCLQGDPKLPPPPA